MLFELMQSASTHIVKLVMAFFNAQHLSGAQPGFYDGGCWMVRTKHVKIFETTTHSILAERLSTRQLIRIKSHLRVYVCVCLSMSPCIDHAQHA